MSEGKGWSRVRTASKQYQRQLQGAAATTSMASCEHVLHELVIVNNWDSALDVKHAARLCTHCSWHQLQGLY